MQSPDKIPVLTLNADTKDWVEASAGLEGEDDCRKNCSALVKPSLKAAPT